MADRISDAARRQKAYEIERSASANDPNCWAHEGMSFNDCCNTQKYGSHGNRRCWDGLWSYQRCCNTFPVWETDVLSEIEQFGIKRSPDSDSDAEHSRQLEESQYQLDRFDKAPGKTKLHFSKRYLEGLEVYDMMQQIQLESRSQQSQQHSDKKLMSSTRGRLEKLLIRYQNDRNSNNNTALNVTFNDRTFLKDHVARQAYMYKMEEEQDVSCAPHTYQQFKFEANHYYDRNVTHWSFLQTQGYLVSQFSQVSRICAAAALTALLIKMEVLYFRTDGQFEETHRVFTEQLTKALALGRLTENHFNNGWPIRVGLRRVMELRSLPERVWRQKKEQHKEVSEKQVNAQSKSSNKSQRQQPGPDKRQQESRLTKQENGKLKKQDDKKLKDYLNDQGISYVASDNINIINSDLSTMSTDSKSNALQLTAEPIPTLPPLTSADVTLHGEPLDVVVCYCSEPLEWLAVFWKLPFTTEDHSHIVKKLINLRLIHKCNHRLIQSEEQERQKLINRWSPHFRDVTVDFVTDYLRADDCSAYVAYIVKYYDVLTNHVLFLHADAGEHIPHLNMIMDLALAIVGNFVPDLKFSHLSLNYVKLGEGGEKMRQDCADKFKREKEIQNLNHNHIYGNAAQAKQELVIAKTKSSSTKNIKSQSTSAQIQQSQQQKQSDSETSAITDSPSSSWSEAPMFSRFCPRPTNPSKDYTNPKNIIIPEDYEWPRLWKRIFQSSVAPSPVSGDVNAYCCVQFVVRKDRIRNRPREFYERALEVWRSEESYFDLFPGRKYVREIDIKGRTPCQLGMYFWHNIFGADLSMDRRQYDPEIPLFLKVTNLEREIYDESYGISSGNEQSGSNNHHLQVDPIHRQLVDDLMSSTPQVKRIYWDEQVHNW